MKRPPYKFKPRTTVFKAWHVKNRTWHTDDPQEPRLCVVTNHGGFQVDPFQEPDRWINLPASEVVILERTPFTDTTGRQLWEGDVRGYAEDPSRFVVVMVNGCWSADYGPGITTAAGEHVLVPIRIDHMTETRHLGNVLENPELAPR